MFLKLLKFLIYRVNKNTDRYLSYQYKRELIAGI